MAELKNQVTRCLVVFIVVLPGTLLTNCGPEGTSNPIPQSSQSSISSASSTSAQASPEERSSNLLDQLTESYSDSREYIEKATAIAKELLANDGIEESEVHIMEAMNRVFTEHVGNQEYAEYLAAYTTLRKHGMSHEEAWNQLAGMVYQTIHPGEGASEIITQRQFGNTWPFSVNQGYLDREGVTLFFIANHKYYAVNDAARKRDGLRSLAEILVHGPKAKKGLQKIIDKGMALRN